MHIAEIFAHQTCYLTYGLEFLIFLSFSLKDNYTFAQPGIQRKVKALEELVSRIDGA